MANLLPDESPITRELRKRFDEKRLELARLERRLDKLKTELLAIKHEHDVRIGSLLRESDQLDYDIFEARKIQDLLDRGYSQSDAKKLVEERAFAEFMKARAAAEAENDSEALRGAAPSNKKLKEKGELKKLFRKLAMKYHPDRAQGDEEKMKEVNRAYAEGNIEALRALERDEQVEVPILDNETLERHISSIENAIDRLKQRFRAFTRSEWFLLKKELQKAKKEEQDLFADWEKRLMAEITQKKRTLTGLRKKHTEPSMPRK